MKSTDPLEGLATFIAVADALSFSRAAETLGLSRVTVSTQLKVLEARLGVRLLQRTTRSVRLTEAGSTFRNALAGVLPQIRQAELAATSFQHEAVGRLRISGAPEMGSTYLAPAIADFLVDHPGLTVDLVLGHKAISLVEEGFDLAIRATISVDSHLIARKLGSATLHVCASPAYLERQGMPSQPEELAARACLHFSGLQWGRVWHFTRHKTTKRIPISPRLEINDGTSLRAAALRGAGITMLPSFIVGPDLRDGRLVPLFPEWTVGQVPIQAIYPDNRHIAAKVRAFVTYLAKRFAGYPELRGR